MFDGLTGLAAHVHLAAVLPDNVIAFEYPIALPDWWPDIVEGLPDPIVVDGMIDGWDRRAGRRHRPERAARYLSPEDTDVFA